MLWELMNWKRLNVALTAGCDTQCSGLVTGWLDFMILGAFSNLSDAMIVNIVREEQEWRAQGQPGLVGSLLLPSDESTDVGSVTAGT